MKNLTLVAIQLATLCCSEKHAINIFAYIEFCMPLFAWSHKNINESISAKLQNLLENFNVNKFVIVKFGRFMLTNHMWVVNYA